MAKFSLYQECIYTAVMLLHLLTHNLTYKNIYTVFYKAGSSAFLFLILSWTHYLACLATIILQHDEFLP